MAISPPPRNYHGWLPASPVIHDVFLKEVLSDARAREQRRDPHDSSVEEFNNAIEADSTMIELFKKIFLEADPGNQIENFVSLLYCLDVVVVGPPKYVTAEDQGAGISESISVSIYLLFDLLSNTAAAYDLFRMTEFNNAMKQLLDRWGRYLTTTDSTKTLTDGPEGWFSETSLKKLDENAGGKFNDIFVVYDDNAVNRGYSSWDEFFTRRVRPEHRPIISRPGRSVIYNACESTFDRYQRNVKAHDKFWLKGMPYSLYDIFDGDQNLTDSFVGGTVYQAFLNPQDYHRWHSPVAGEVEVARVISGTYYAVLPDDGYEGNQHWAIVRCQPWLTVSAARAIIVIRTKNPDIGLVCVIPIGMVEVSTCELFVKPGQWVNAGSEIGTFHYGGSSHAVIFNRNTKLTFEHDIEKCQTEGGTPPHMHANKIIASVDQ